MKKCLTIAGSDSGGGAGIQADLKTFAALGVHGSSVVTAVTAQNTKTITAVHNIPPDVIEKQINAIFDDIGADAIKIGMLSNSEIISTVSSALNKINIKISNNDKNVNDSKQNGNEIDDSNKLKIVLDPVMVAASGAKLLEDNAIEALKKELITLATIVTPNIPEAEILVNQKIATKLDMRNAAKEILELGCTSVLIKGGHIETDDGVIDTFYDGKNFTEFKNKRINKEGHGTGCTLSSAIAAYLAKEDSLQDAVKNAICYVHKALEQGYKTGSQNYVLNHFAT